MNLLKLISTNPKFLIYSIILILLILPRFLKPSWRGKAYSVVLGLILTIPGIFIIIGVLIIPSNGNFLLRLLFSLFGLFLSFVGLAILFPGITKYFPELKPKKCTTCGQAAKDVLLTGGYTIDKFYCRSHLLEKFKTMFFAFPHKMVVFYPEQERKYCETMYPYYPLSEMVPNFHFSNKEKEKISEILNSISGKCLECQNQTTIAYFPKGILKWKDTGPDILKTDALPIFLCPLCTVEKILPALRSNQKYFSENGLAAPYKEEGVFINTFL